MKVRKFFESFYTYDLPIHKLHDSIVHDHRNINGFTTYMDNSGTMYWDLTGVDDARYSLLATPYWDNELQLPINILSGDDDIYDTVFKLKTLKNDDDIERFKVYYYNIIDDLTSKLNNRLELRRNIETILSHGRVVRVSGGIGGKYIGWIQSMSDINIDRISDRDVNKLLEITRKSELIVANKFNL